MSLQKEIERKYLVDVEEFKTWAASRTEEHPVGSYEIVQGYLIKGEDRTLRIRKSTMRNNTVSGVVNIKIGQSKEGVDEFEYDVVSEKEIDKLLSHCPEPLIRKTRYIYVYDGLVWEIDQFHGHKEGLIIAEVELESFDVKVTVPDWVTEEVTGNPLYSNRNM